MSNTTINKRPASELAAKAGRNLSESEEPANLQPVMALVIDRLKQNPSGLHFGEIVELITAEYKNIPVFAITKALGRIVESAPELVEKPSRGLYRYRAGRGQADAGKQEDVAHEELSMRYGPTSLRPRVSVKARIVAAAVELLRANPEGLGYRILINTVHQNVAGATRVTIERTVSRLPKLAPKEVEKSCRGFYRYRGKPAETIKVRAVAEERRPSGTESAFYQTFADWLLNDTEECTRAVPLGGKAFGVKWGTPDVIGILRKKMTDPVEFPPEIVSAEIKSDDHELVTAFGQACAYKLFSHKSYLVVPRTAAREDIDRLDSLCLVLGIGLVLFDSANPTKPDFEIRVRPAKHAPDMYYVNTYLKLVPQLYE